MKNLLLVFLVFAIGVGWGAFFMAVPTIRKMREMIAWQVRALDAMKKVIEQEEKMNKTLNEFLDSNDIVVSSTKSVIKSVDKLMKELADEI